ncbi:MAG: hypothetical protein K2M73_02825 [Lachnospiraceae bacterium]|nr:hypothetical protein [Lachnospiraceae bacterium]
MKVKKKLLSLIGVAVMVCMMSNAALASSAGLTANITPDYISARYEYSQMGNVLIVKIDFTEKHTTTGQVHSSSCQSSLAGGYTSVSVGRNADAGYKYTTMTAYGYVGGTQKAKLGPLYP